MPNGYTGNEVTHLRVYVDNNDIYDSSNKYVDLDKTFPPGGHSVVSIAWNAKGECVKGYSTFTVK